METGQIIKQFKLTNEILQVLLERSSPLDLFSFVGNLTSKDQIDSFLNGYGINTDAPIDMAELFGHFQESLQFIRKYFLKPNRENGLDYKIPTEILQLNNIRDLYWLGRESVGENESLEVKIWASIVLKVMHTLMHVNKDLRQDYFSHIQTQIFDRFYKHLDRRGGKLFLESRTDSIEIADFQTKSKKTRDSVLIKLLHKKESVAEQLFDTIGVRIIAKNKFDCVRILKFLHENHIIITQNIKPSRSHNTLIDLDKFRDNFDEVMEQDCSLETSELIYNKLIASTDAALSSVTFRKKNEHTLENYRSIHITCRQLIKYLNPMALQLEKLRMTAYGDNSDLAKMVQKLDTSSLTKELRFFYPYELQVTDVDSHRVNTEGESSHKVYKKSQHDAATQRLFSHLINFKNNNRKNDKLY